MRGRNGRRKQPPYWVNYDKFGKSLKHSVAKSDDYCSSTILPLAYSNRLNFDRNDRPSRFSDSASSGNTIASTSDKMRPPSSTMAGLCGAFFAVPSAVVTVPG